LIRDYIPTAEAPTFLSLPMSDKIRLLQEKAAEKIRVQLDPIAQAQQTLLNGIV
jgi:hypothetical protein